MVETAGKICAVLCIWPRGFVVVVVEAGWLLRRVEEAEPAMRFVVVGPLQCRI